MRSLKQTLAAFYDDDRGVFAVIFALMSIVLIALAGAGIDYAMWSSARTAAQLAADAGALAAAASPKDTQKDMQDIAYSFSTEHLLPWPDIKLQTVKYDSARKRVVIEIDGTVPTYFLGLVGVNTLPVHVTTEAERATNGMLELALVLDNTWSMSDSDGSGASKIQTLKAAAHGLLDAIMQGNSSNVRVGVVPYAEYVNVGVFNRSKPWMSVPPDVITTTPKTCVTKTTKNVCTKGTPKTCTRIVDGVQESYDCTPSVCSTVTVPPYQSCSGGGTTKKTWYGCVLSRTPRNLRLSDAEPTTDYVGLLGTSQRCMTPIVPLTSSESTVRTAINGMVVNVGSYRPSTHIPSGLVWGINVLSPTEPFVQGDTYDAANVQPRKALILMTDGDNTLRFNAPTGEHLGLSGNAKTAATQKGQTDDDTTSLCSYAKSQAIEVFTVSFGALEASSDSMLRNCATDEAHYFSATSADQLKEAFKNIADRLRVVRIVQ